MKTDKQELEEFGEFLNDQGFKIDLSDECWWDDFRFAEYNIKDIFELSRKYASKRVAEIVVGNVGLKMIDNVNEIVQKLKDKLK